MVRVEWEEWSWAKLGVNDTKMLPVSLVVGKGSFPYRLFPRGIIYGTKYMVVKIGCHAYSLEFKAVTLVKTDEK